MITGALIADEMGLGKTIQAIGIINACEWMRRVIVICPATLKINWQRELEKWLTRPLRVRVQNAGARWVGRDADIVVINYDILKRYATDLNAGEWDLKVLDEAHYIKSAEAVRTKAAMAIEAKRKLLLTGTPILNRPREIYNLLTEIDPETYHAKKFFRFGLRYCGARQIMAPVWTFNKATNRRERVQRLVWQFDGSSHEAELEDRLRSSIMVRRLKRDVLTDLPAKRRQVIELDGEEFDPFRNEDSELPGLTRVEELEAAVEIAKAGDDESAYNAAVQELEEGRVAAFTEMSSKRKALGLAKLPQVIAFVRDLLDNGDKVILFMHHRECIDALRAEFPQAAVVIGGYTAEQKMTQVDRFQNDPSCDLFIGNDAAAEGLTLTASSHVVFGEGDWVPGKLCQKEDRAHRIGQRDSVLVTHLVAAGTLDAVMIKRTVAKQNIIDACLDKPGVVRDIKAPTTVIEAAGPEAETFQTATAGAAQMSPELVVLAHRCMISLRMVCDGAAREDASGFSGCDVRIGHSFASQNRLSQKQARIAARLAIKYKRQLGEDTVFPFYAALGIEPKQKGMK